MSFYLCPGFRTFKLSSVTASTLVLMVTISYWSVFIFIYIYLLYPFNLFSMSPQPLSKKEWFGQLVYTFICIMASFKFYFQFTFLGCLQASAISTMCRFHSTACTPIRHQFQQLLSLNAIPSCFNLSTWKILIHHPKSYTKSYMGPPTIIWSVHSPTRPRHNLIIHLYIYYKTCHVVL